MLLNFLFDGKFAASRWISSTDTEGNVTQSADTYQLHKNESIVLT